MNLFKFLKLKMIKLISVIFAVAHKVIVLFFFADDDDQCI